MKYLYYVLLVLTALPLASKAYEIRTPVKGQKVVSVYDTGDRRWHVGLDTSDGTTFIRGIPAGDCLEDTSYCPTGYIANIRQNGAIGFGLTEGYSCGTNQVAIGLCTQESMVVENMSGIWTYLYNNKNSGTTIRRYFTATYSNTATGRQKLRRDCKIACSIDPWCNKWTAELKFDQSGTPGACYGTSSTSSAITYPGGLPYPQSAYYHSGSSHFE